MLPETTDTITKDIKSFFEDLKNQKLILENQITDKLRKNAERQHRNKAIAEQIKKEEEEIR